MLLGAHPLQHAEIQVAQRLLALRVNVLSVFETAAGQDERQVVVRVPTAAAESRSEQDLGCIEQRRTIRLLRRLQALNEPGKVRHEVVLHDGKLAEGLADHIGRLVTTEEIKILHKATSDFLKES